jgi:hypothetical protein
MWERCTSVIVNYNTNANASFIFLLRLVPVKLFNFNEIGESRKRHVPPPKPIGEHAADEPRLTSVARKNAFLVVGVSEFSGG